MFINGKCSNTGAIYVNIVLLALVTPIHKQSCCLLPIVYSVGSISILALLANRNVLIYEG